MSLAGRQIIMIDLNFHLRKGLEIFDKNSADKIQIKNYKEVVVVVVYLHSIIDIIFILYSIIYSISEWGWGEDSWEEGNITYPTYL